MAYEYNISNVIIIKLLIIFVNDKVAKCFVLKDIFFMDKHHRTL